MLREGVLFKFNSGYPEEFGTYKVVDVVYRDYGDGPFYLVGARRVSDNRPMNLFCDMYGRYDGSSSVTIVMGVIEPLRYVKQFRLC